MRVTPEAITVLPEPERGELAVIMAGLRITFSAEEAALLARDLGQALVRLGGASSGDCGSSAGTGASAVRSVAPDPLAGLPKLDLPAPADVPARVADPLDDEPEISRLAESIKMVFKRTG